MERLEELLAKKLVDLTLHDVTDLAFYPTLFLLGWWMMRGFVRLVKGD